jgi:membrane protease YdiL (CAAX protease family)
VTQLSSKAIRVELSVVLALSLGASAFYSIVSFLAKLTEPGGLAGSNTKINTSLSDREWVDAAYQFLGIALGLAPIALALLLLWRDYGAAFLTRIGLQLRGETGHGMWLRAWARGLGLAAAIGIPGLGFYLASRGLGLSSKVVPTEIAQHWWVPVALLLLAMKAALVEEVIVIGYLYERLGRLGFRSRGIVVASALLRGTYHLYQGIGGFVGNAIMGLVIGAYYQRWKERGEGALWPMVIAHFLIDATVFVGYPLVDLSQLL